MRRLLVVLALPLACATAMREGTTVTTSSQGGRGGASAPIVALPMPTTPTVAFRIEFLTGAADDPRGKEGLTALTAQLMVEGGTATLTASEVASALFPIAAVLAVTVDEETTTFVGRCPKQDVERFLPILEDAIRRPRFDPGELDRLRSRALDHVEKTLRSENDEALGMAALALSLYGEHPYAHPTAGTAQGLRGITLEDVKAHWARVFVTSRLVVGVAGAYEASLPARIARDLASLPPGTPRGPLAAPVTSAPRFLLVEKGTSPTAISMGFTWEVKRGDPDFPALVAGVIALGQHRHSGYRLYRALREIRGLNYGDYAYAEHFVEEPGGTMPAPGHPRSHQEFTVWIRPVEPAHRVFAIRAALYEVDRWARDGITASELETVRQFLHGWTRMLEQTPTRKLGDALDDRFYGLDRPWLELLEARIGSLTVAEVNAAIRRHVDPARLRVAVATHGADALAKELRAGSPSPITYSVPKPKEVLETDRVIERFPLGIHGDGDVRVVRAEELFER